MKFCRVSEIRQILKDLFSTFGTLILERHPRRGLPFLNGQERKQRRPPRTARRPLTADNQLGEKGCALAASLPLFRNPELLIPRFGVLQGYFKALCQDHSDYAFSLCVNKKSNYLASPAVQIYLAVKS
ncbi:hypothetical protein EV682_11772 [Iodobacter fluviatilis]|uniref:Uncharacterized protein n=1 Tax=Iodobacter fluviatilis TaxID=537 RepID=A0A377SWX1_9NEIS|nr:hypothetical protein EV682_11772 [Iodobacter fluviatilis]STR44816.1 Uncharacterised protein [Iodobacter fluviatilis]